MQPRHLVLIDAAVPVIVGAVILVGVYLHGGGSVNAATVALVAAAAAALWGRRRFPGSTLFVCSALVGVLLHVAGGAGSVAVLAPAVALYSLALARGRRIQLLAGGAAIVAVVLADSSAAREPTVLQTLAHVMLVAIPLLAAEAIRTHRSYVAVVLDRLELAERTREHEAAHRAEQERLRIARELHDVVAHTLTGINVQAAAAAETSAEKSARETLERIEAASHDALRELRAVLGVLRDPAGDKRTLSPRSGVDDVPPLVASAQASGTDVTLKVVGTRPARIPQATSLAAYRIVQESLTNAQRHAPGRAATVTLTYGAASITISVENPITAAVGSRSDSTGGVGLLGMKERTAAVGGAFRASSENGCFRVLATLPLEPGQ